MNVMTLDELKEGQRARIFKVKGRGAFRQRLVEMGFVKGQTVETLRFAPMKDPVEFRILHSEVSLRRDEAALIEIELIKSDSPEVSKQPAAPSGLSATIPAGQPTSGHTSDGLPPTDNATTFTSKQKETIEVCMVGNPNAGKTSLYHARSGAFEHVANYSGVTVDAKSIGFDYREYRIELTDLPGSYSFSPYTPEERYVREHLLLRQPDVVLNVVDASNIERNLYLTTQLIDMDCKVVLAMNMFDELKKTGARLDTELLGQLLGMPVVPTVASRHEGLKPLAEKITAVYNDAEPHLRHTHIPYPEEIETAIRKLQEAIWKDPAFSDMYSSRFLAIKLLEEDAAVLQTFRCLQDFKALETLAQTEIKHIKAIFDEDPAHLMSD
ncbi:MAG: FeoA domain-containing protein, partial [Bacteroidales bacterium]|nr:FeoA domain-containing protein [Bacteroidales bacterium]